MEYSNVGWKADPTLAQPWELDEKVSTDTKVMMGFESWGESLPCFYRSGTLSFLMGF